MVRRTSKEAYDYIISNKILGEMQELVYSGLYKYGPCTANELYKNFNFKNKNQANMGTRLSELREMGMTFEVGKRLCDITHRNVLLWDVTGRMHPKLVDKSTSVKQRKKDRIVRSISKVQAKIKRDRGVEPTKLLNWLSKIIKNVGEI